MSGFADTGRWNFTLYYACGCVRAARHVRYGDAPTKGDAATCELHGDTTITRRNGVGA